MDKEKINVVNLHITDYCNFNCKFCFVKKEKFKATLEDLKICVNKIYEYFSKNNIQNGRINLAGGEPLIYNNLVELIDYIYSKNIEVSIITNGYFLNKDFLEKVKGKVCMIGISIDSLNNDVNIKLGRCQNGEKYCNEESYLSKCKLIKDSNIKLKINVCVNKYNYKENFTNFFKKAKADKIKFLQIKYEKNVNEECRELLISKEQFEEFSRNNYAENIVFESDESMIDSYLIVDSKCNVSTSNNHKSNMCLLNHSFEECLYNLNFDKDKFNKRYNI